jgi:WhiB family redox-sensing transcriptional regulator
MTTAAPLYPAFDGTQLCAQTDPEAFHPPASFQGNDAKRVCSGCDFLDECREYAVWYDLEGIWGGTTAGWRKKERVRRGLAPLSADRPGKTLSEQIRESPGVPADDLAKQLGCNPRTIQRHRAKAA